MEMYSKSNLDRLKKKFTLTCSIFIAVDVIFLSLLGISFVFINDSTYLFLTILDSICLVIMIWANTFVSTSFLLKERIFATYISSLLEVKPIILEGEVSKIRKISRIKHIDTNLITIKTNVGEKEVYVLDEFSFKDGEFVSIEVRNNFVTNIRKGDKDE